MKRGLDRLFAGRGAERGTCARLPRRPFAIRNGKIAGTVIELEAARHCNVSCRSCVTHSPVQPRSFADPESLYRDLSILGRAYHAKAARIRGGEPLLHPALDDVLSAVRRSGIADRLEVITNGLPLSRMPSPFWDAVDEIRVSSYPAIPLDPLQLADWREKARAHRVDLFVVYFDLFRESYSEIGTADRELVRRIYATCEAAHVLRCHMIHGGSFYKCSQSVPLSELAHRPGGAASEVSGVRISDGPTLRDDLLSYLESAEPLPACGLCLGSVGRLFPHELVSRIDFAGFQRHPTEQLLDREYLGQRERGLSSAHLRCVQEVAVEAIHGRTSRVLTLVTRTLSRRSVRRIVARPLESLLRSYRNSW